MLTPNGLPANKIEKLMLLALWANTLKEEWEQNNQEPTKKLIFAGLGKPTYPINAHTVASYLSYWQQMDEASQLELLNSTNMQGNSAIDYGDPRGDTIPRKLMAASMSAWYDSEIKPEHILFTVGGIGALKVIFETFNMHYADTPGYRVITPFPYYSVYATNPMHRLHPIHVMQESGYKLTAHALDASIKEAYALAETDGGWPKAVLICNPSNPLGSVIDEVELRKIVEVLRAYPELHLIFDEAYAEMSYVDMPSFIQIAPDLKERVVILRSATKALSAAGERMAVLMAFDPWLMHEMLNKNISYFVHAPRSAQIAYAQTMANFDSAEKQRLAVYYQKKVDYVIHRLHAMGAAMPDPLYHVDATFYALADFSDLFGLELPVEALRVFQKTGRVTTDEELAYYLLFKDELMIAPLSYFGLAQNHGFMRITCSGSAQELQELMDRLEQRLFAARKKKQVALLEEVVEQVACIKDINEPLYTTLIDEIIYIKLEQDNCLTLKAKIHLLQAIKIELHSKTLAI
jgi:aspartate aminotransferase/aminotransferase